jgi:hypothetical protein
MKIYILWKDFSNVILYVSIKGLLKSTFWVSMVGNQIVNLIPNHYSGHIIWTSYL